VEAADLIARKEKQEVEGDELGSKGRGGQLGKGGEEGEEGLELSDLEGADGEEGRGFEDIGCEQGSARRRIRGIVAALTGCSQVFVALLLAAATGNEQSVLHELTLDRLEVGGRGVVPDIGEKLQAESNEHSYASDHTGLLLCAGERATWWSRASVHDDASASSRGSRAWQRMRAWDA
jgi:hypothetical protein